MRASAPASVGRPCGLTTSENHSCAFTVLPSFSYKSPSCHITSQLWCVMELSLSKASMASCALPVCTLTMPSL